MAVRDITINAIEPYEGGRSFGDTGPYELARGTVTFALDPADPANRRVTDLALAERGSDDLVAAEADFRVLRPADPTRGNGGLFYSVANRGNVTLPFNLGPGPDLLQFPPGTIPPGDAFLLRQGWTVAWSGWQFDLTRGPGPVALTVPQALENGSPVAGDFRIDLRPGLTSPTMRILDGTAIMAGRTQPVYPPDGLEQPEATMTVRESPNGQRVPVPRQDWEFATEADGVLQPDGAHVWVKGGFQAGQLYELVYRTAYCPVAGIGFTAVRDFVSHLRTTAGESGALAPGVSRVLGMGISQTGRFLRQWLRDGFNSDESGRRVFDGLFIHIAGGRGGEFNHRYAQPNEALAHGFGDLTPIAWESPEGGLLDHQASLGTAPKIFWANSGWEYWRGDASLTHTTLDGAGDLPDPANVRSYLMSSTDHLGANTVMARLMGIANDPGGVDPSPLIRALLGHLDRWVRDGIEPPASRVPRVAEGTAVPRERVLEQAAAYPGMQRPSPEALPSVPRVDLGPDAGRGIGRWPAVTGEAYEALVSAVDTDGNEIAGVRLPEVAVPVATLTGWNTQRHHSRLNPLSAMPGSRHTFARTKAEREASGDPRPSLEERYSSREDYAAKATAAADAMLAAGFLLAEDRQFAIDRALAGYDAVMSPVAPK